MKFVLILFILTSVQLQITYYLSSHYKHVLEQNILKHLTEAEHLNGYEFMTTKIQYILKIGKELFVVRTKLQCRVETSGTTLPYSDEQAGETIGRRKVSNEIIEVTNRLIGFRFALDRTFRVFCVEFTAEDTVNGHQLKTSFTYNIEMAKLMLCDVDRNKGWYEKMTRIDDSDIGICKREGMPQTSCLFKSVANVIYSMIRLLYEDDQKESTSRVRRCRSDDESGSEVKVPKSVMKPGLFTGKKCIKEKSAKKTSGEKQSVQFKEETNIRLYASTRIRRSDSSEPTRRHVRKFGEEGAKRYKKLVTEVTTLVLQYEGDEEFPKFEKTEPTKAGSDVDLGSKAVAIFPRCILDKNEVFHESDNDGDDLSDIKPPKFIVEKCVEAEENGSSDTDTVILDPSDEASGSSNN
ncbi:hypothetical protein ECANGB1_2135 [Enterospora canceri]|uniref:Uncharacterized protein n=1 Tax=Enterospora canceri TaxID=1081671 RepID=A0A1Y1S500_9MICR|nr:hypothetical protein ECANGB1_2135 [Enterospora canceri]